MTAAHGAGGPPPDPDRADSAGTGTPAARRGRRRARRQERLPGIGESRYPPAAPGRPEPTPPTVRIELVLVGGREGKQLRAAQAAAIREALRWFAEHPNPDPPENPPKE